MGINAPLNKKEIGEKKMELGEKIWKVAKYLPRCSFANLIMKGAIDNNNFKSNVRWAAHLFYFVFLVAPLTYWGMHIPITGKLNPFEQRRVRIEYQERVERESILFEKIFGLKGYADKNNDGKITFDELAEAHKKMDLEDLYKIDLRPKEEYRPKDVFNCPLYFTSLLPSTKVGSKGLEKAIQSYEAEYKDTPLK